MASAQEKKRSVANTEKPTEDNQCVSSHLGKLWHLPSVYEKQPDQGKEAAAAAAAAVNRRRHLEYVISQLGVYPREEHECRRDVSKASRDENIPAVLCALSRVEVGSLEYQQQSATIPTNAQRDASCELVVRRVNQRDASVGLSWVLDRTNYFQSQGPLPMSCHRGLNHVALKHVPIFLPCPSAMTPEGYGDSPVWSYLFDEDVLLANL
ncbi:hypothetical protein MRX96_019141 [Rhipicephalus microplus]